MMRNVLKGLSFITALCVFFGTMSVMGFAHTVELTGETEEITALPSSPEIKGTLPNSAVASYSYSSGIKTDVDTTVFFYNQLTSSQKELYNQIYEAGITETVALDMSKISIKGTGSTSDEAKQNAVTCAQNDIICAFSALNNDKPMVFWLSGFKFYYGGDSSFNGSQYTYEITGLNLLITINETHYSDMNDIQTKYNAIEQQVNEFEVNGFSRYEKLKSIHDNLVNRVVYDDTQSKPNIYDPYGALVNGLCVCEGYAETIKLICDREGIPCLNVIGLGNGGRHKWNLIQMEDGKWYTFDATWDDQGDTVFYSFFLIGSDTVAPYFGSSDPDSAVHVATGEWFSGYPVMSYPAVSSTSYCVGIVRYGAKDIAVNTDKNLILVGKDVTNITSGFVNNGTYSVAKTGSGTTGSQLTLSDGTNFKTYNVAMRGDVNKSDSLTADDYNRIVSISATSSTVADNSAEFYAADMNQDGAIDAFDAILLDLYMNGNYSFE